MMDALPQVGDHLISRRPGFMHHGIYAGHERVIHYGGNSTPGVRAKVEEVSLARFAGASGYAILPYRKRRFDREESVRRARTRLGEDHYCAVSNNCQHFVEWCIMGLHKSGQVSRRAGVAAGAVVATGTGIVSGLTAIGIPTGGVAVVCAAPTLAVAGLLNRTMYRQNPGQPRSERLARRIGSATTAAIGVVGAVSAIGAPGLAAASPAIAAAAVGYGAYRVSRNLLRRVDKRPLDRLPPPAASALWPRSHLRALPSRPESVQGRPRSASDNEAALSSAGLETVRMEPGSDRWKPRPSLDKLRMRAFGALRES